jgi:hypothetical protein
MKKSSYALLEVSYFMTYKCRGHVAPPTEFWGIGTEVFKTHKTETVSGKPGRMEFQMVIFL